jgi:hypothetical protein
MMDQAVVITGRENIYHAQRLAQLGAMKLELLGMKHSSGRSMIAVIKKTYNLKGNKQHVYAEFEKIVKSQTPENWNKRV